PRGAPGQARRAPADGYVGSPRVLMRAGTTELVIPTEHPELARVVGRGRARFRMRFRGAFSGALPDSLPADALVHDVSVRATPGGLTFELAVDAAAAGRRWGRSPCRGGVARTL